jgi:hypothetical protein
MSAQTIRELDQVVLTSDVPAEGLVAGDVGAVVLVYRDAQAYEVEFMTLEGKTASDHTGSFTGSPCPTPRNCSRP